MSNTPDIYSTKTRKELYEILHKGILLQEGKLWFCLSNNDDYRNEMIPTRMFSYENHKSHKWRSVQNSRFERVVKILNISNLKIQIKIKPQFLSQNVNYGAFLVFKFCDPRKFSNKPMYVNLEYKIGCETLHAYFATWREDEWMMIELCRFLHDEKDSDFEVQLVKFSRYYCGSGPIYVEGIEFRAINDEKLGVQKVFELKSDRVEQLPVDYNVITKSEDGEKSESNLKKSYILPAWVLGIFCNKPSVKWKSIPDSRFEPVAEFISNQVLRITNKIKTQRLSSNTDYACYLIFRLAENCHGLQCPVKVRDVLLRKNKESSFLYFRTPSSVNLHNIKRVPKQREDGLMEVILWELNSNKLNGDHLPMHLKLRCYEGTLHGLIVYGIEFRPI